MSKKYFVSAQGRDFAVTLDGFDASGRFRMQIVSAGIPAAHETAIAERVGRCVGGAVEIDGRIFKLEGFSEGVELGNRQQRVACTVDDRPRLQAAQAATETRSRHRVLTAPLPGQVAAVLVRPEERVRAGQRLVLIEAMKMQNPILAERDGTVLQVFVSPGDTVQVGARLVDVGD